MEVGLSVGNIMAVQNKEQVSGKLGPRSVREAWIPQVPVVIPLRRSGGGESPGGEEEERSKQGTEEEEEEKTRE